MSLKSSCWILKKVHPNGTEVHSMDFSTFLSCILLLPGANIHCDRISSIFSFVLHIFWKLFSKNKFLEESSKMFSYSFFVIKNSCFRGLNKQASNFYFFSNRPENTYISTSRSTIKHTLIHINLNIDLNAWGSFC